VNVYTPGADVYYVGDAECVNCHGDTHGDWAATGHADAWAGLQTSDHAQGFCEPCHSVDYSAFENPDNASMNSGYDEVPIAKFEDVQCESCHGPASAHIADPNNVDMAFSLKTPTCNVCHDGTHHPFQTQWEESAHNFDPATAAHGAGARGYCGPCHSGEEFVQAFNTTDKINYDNLYSDAKTAGELSGVTCTVCHDPHSGDNPGQLRALEAVTLVSGDVIDTGKEGQLCMQCHQARRVATTQIDTGYAHFGPHSGVQGDAVYGASGYEGVATNITGFQSSGHGLIADACASCHVYMTDYDPVTDFANVGHTFEPRVESCNECHAQESGEAFAAIAEVRTLRPKDYDADGTIEPLQTEVTGLMETLVEVLVTNFSDDLSGTDVTMPPSAMADSLANTSGDGSTEAQDFRKAGYNLVYSLDDGSLGIHNPAYIIQLLQQSILSVDGTQLNSGSPNNLYDASDVPTGLTAMR
jgi:predicted CXXCH cytochrome family protein